MIPAEPTPILDALATLPLSADERDALAALPGVRTFGDLLVVIDRGEVEKALAAKVKKAAQK